MPKRGCRGLQFSAQSEDFPDELNLPNDIPFGNYLRDSYPEGLDSVVAEAVQFALRECDQQGPNEPTAQGKEHLNSKITGLRPYIDQALVAEQHDTSQPEPQPIEPSAQTVGGGSENGVSEQV